MLTFSTEKLVDLSRNNSTTFPIETTCNSELHSPMPIRKKNQTIRMSTKTLVSRDTNPSPTKHGAIKRRFQF